MLFKSLAAVAALAVGVAADGASINQSLLKIDTDTGILNQTIIPFDGNVFVAGAILIASLNVLNDVNNATTTASNSAPLSNDEAIALIPVVNRLTADVNVTLDELISKKPDFQKDDFDGIVQYTLQQQQTAARNLSATIIAKVPSGLQSSAQVIIAPLDTYFTNAINAFST